MDSTFALALRHLGWVLRWTSSAEDSLVRVYAFRTAAFNRGLTPRESLLVVADSLDAALWLPPSLERSVPAGDVQSPAFDGQYLHGVKVDFLRTARREIAILKQAVARYPDDPEAWYQLGEALFHVGPKAGVTLEDQRKAFDHAIALDPGFLEPEPHAISLAIQFGDTALGRQYASAYLARNPGVDQGAGVRIVNALLTLPPLDSASLARWADSVRDERALERAREALGRWADPAETGLRLIESTIAPAGRLRDPSDVPRLAHWLASRGHVRAAAAMLGRESSAGRPHLYVDLALLGAVPAETAAATLKGWQSDELLSSLSLPWWAAQGDTATLVRLARRADSTSRIEDQAPWEQDQRRYLAEAARAYLALARHDTAEAVRRFPTLPDSLCLECDFDRLQTAMLLAAAKRGGEAYERLQLVFPAGDLKEPPRPSETLWVLERGKVAEGLGDRATAARAYSWVAGIWRNADPELRPYVREARAGLERLARRQTR
jgi:serine/threonine-protein kinase